MSRKRTAFVSGAILLVAVGILGMIFLTEPTATRGGATKETAMLVDVVEVEAGTFRPTIEAMGTVEAEQDVILSPRVAGEIVERADAFVPGGFVDQGEILLQIDPSDFRNALARARSDLRQAEADLELEMGRQEVARRDYELLGESLRPEDENLVLREPQLERVRSEVESARAAVNQAELDLQRTTIRAPFDAHILSRNVNLGSQVAPGDELGRLVGIDTYWVVAAVPLSKLRFLSIPDGSGETGSRVRIRNRTAWPEDVHREGRVDELLGDLEGTTRMARVLVAVEDPLARRGAAGESGDPGETPPLIIGSYVEARIEGEPLADVVRLDRDYVRQDDTVWVMEEGRLSIRAVEIVLQDADYAYIAGGVRAGEKVVSTNLSTVTEGARLRLEGVEGSTEEGGHGEPPESETGTESSGNGGS